MEMAQKFLTTLDMVQNEIKNLKIDSRSSAPSNPVEGQIYFNTTDFTLYIYKSGAWKDISSANVTKAELANTTSGNAGAKLIGVASIAGISGNNVQDVLENLKNYVDSVKQNLDIKKAVRVATTSAEANIDIDNAPLVIDGVTLVVGDRVLVKDGAFSSVAGESVGSDVRNGIYEVQAVGASVKLVRASDADTDDKVSAGMFTFVQEGNTNSDNGFVLATNEVIVLGTTPLTFTQFSGAGKVVAGNGLVKNGDVLDIVGTPGRIVVDVDSVDIDPNYEGQISITTVGTITTGEWQGEIIDVAYGGTGATNAQQARANLGATGKFAQDIGDGSSTSFTVTHNLGTQDVIVMIREAGSPFTKVEADIQVTDNNNIFISFATAPSVNQYRVIVVG
jgi:hypothetical protein